MKHYLQLGIKVKQINPLELLIGNFLFLHFHLISASVLGLQVSILLAIELIWNLCEVLFIDAAPG